MKIQKIVVASALAVALPGLLAQTASAGTAVIASSDGGASTFEYNSRMLRISAPDNQNGYMLVRDGTIYTVMQEDGRTMVFDAGSMMKGIGGMVQAPSDLNADVISLEKTGRSETVAGIKGDVYELRFVDEDGKEQREDMVLSDDRRAREFRDALFMMLEVTAKLTSGTRPEEAQEMWNRLEALDSGVLRYGNELKITSISSDRVDPSRFELPAAPVDLQGLGDMLGGMSQGGTGDSGGTGSAEDTGDGKKPGLFSSMMGAIGGQAERQSERVDDSVEQEINRESDEQVDNAVNKAFKKLFGRD